MSDFTKNNFTVINYKDYEPTITFGDLNIPSMPKKIKVWKPDEFSYDNVFFTSFSVHYSFNSFPTASITIPMSSEMDMSALELGTNVQISSASHVIFNGILKNMKFDGEHLNVECVGLSYLLQKIYNPAVAFVSTSLGNIISSIINEGLKLQNYDGTYRIQYINSKEQDDEIILDGSKYTNIDSYSLLQQITSSAYKIMFETIEHGISTFVIGSYSDLDDYFDENTIYLSHDFYFDRTKSYTLDGVANSIFVLDKNSGKTIMIYPKSVPNYVPTNTPTKIYSNNKVDTNGRLLGSIAIYDIVPKGYNVESIGEALINASYLNYTGATYKFPGLSILAFPGNIIDSEAGVGLIVDATYSFANQEMWEEFKVQPKGI